MLSEEERTRAGRFYFRKDREEFLVARGLLRSILSRYVGAEPHRLQFSCAPHGKPALAHARGDESIRFNVSHSHGVMLCAVARNREVGVDVELIRPGVAAQMPAECDSTLPGLRDILALPEKDRSEAFFACWTRKEAYLKARGEGLAKARGRSAMCLAHDAGVTGIISDGIRSWTYRRLVPSPRHIGALIVEKKDVCCKRDITVVQFGMDTIDR
jgi:4'-phosphopantetheinyl transferase